MPIPSIEVKFSDLRTRPEFVDVIADRMWHAWWRSSGAALETVSSHLREFLAADHMPRGIVAHDGDRYAGSTLLIGDDLRERPQYSPWIAALWVEQEYRERGIGARLMEHGVETAFSLGFGQVYLCAKPAVSGFYARRRWVSVEEGVGPDELTVFVRR